MVNDGILMPFLFMCEAFFLYTFLRNRKGSTLHADNDTPQTEKAKNLPSEMDDIRRFFYHRHCHALSIYQPAHDRHSGRGGRLRHVCPSRSEKCAACGSAGTGRLYRHFPQRGRPAARHAHLGQQQPSLQLSKWRGSPKHL